LSSQWSRFCQDHKNGASEVIGSGIFKARGEP
jgi:hypothetical protein